jgi:hypothetical protein
MVLTRFLMPETTRRPGTRQFVLSPEKLRNLHGRVVAGA